MLRYVSLAIACIFVHVCASSAHAGWHSMQQSQSDYLREHAAQRDIQAQFTTRVQAEPQPLETPPALPVRIAIVYPAKQVSDYWRRNITAFEARMQALNIPYTLQTHLSAPSGEAQLQAQHIALALREGTDYLILSVDSPLAINLVGRILRSQSATVIVQNLTTPFRAWESAQPFLYSGFDHEEGAQLLANYFQQTFPSGATYAVLMADQHGTISTQRGNTFIKALEPSRTLHLVATYYTDFSRTKAAQATQEILEQFPEVNFIYACSTDIALGALDTLRKAGKTQSILVNGWGGGDTELEALRAGELAVTVMRMSDDAAVAMAEAIALDLAGHKDRVPTIYSGEFTIIERGATPKDIEPLLQRAFRYSSPPAMTPAQNTTTHEGDTSQ